MANRTSGEPGAFGARKSKPRRGIWLLSIIGAGLVLVLLAAIIKAMTPFEPRYVAVDEKPCAFERPWIEGKQRLAQSAQASARGDQARALSLIEEAEAALDRHGPAFSEDYYLRDTASLYSVRDSALKRGDLREAADSARKIFQVDLNGYRAACGSSTEAGWKPPPGLR